MVHKAMLLRVFLLLFALCSAWAQSPLGIVTGVATDPSSSPVPNSKVKLNSIETGITRDLETNQAGNYTFANLAPGQYKLTAEAPGFRQFETVEFPVRAYQTVRQDLHFEVATSNAEITVSEVAASPLTVDSPAVNQSLNRKQILELPTNLRSVYNNSGDSGLTSQVLPLTVPGVVQVGAGAAWLVPGSGANSLKLKVDGIETNFGNFGSPDPVSQPSFESVQEFTANITTTRAEFGGQGTVTTVTRAGTNQFHGDLFWYVRNSALDARNPFFITRQGANIHDYGLSGGGPVIKNKTFAFFTYEGIRGVRAYPLPPTAANVPTAAMRAGDFTGLAALKNPFGGSSPFDGNKILPAFLSPQAVKAQQLLFPLPNFGPSDNTVGNFRASYNGPEIHNIFEARVDHNFSDRNSAFLRYQWKKDNYEIPGARSVLPPTSVGTSTNIRRVNFFTIGDVFTLRPNLINEFRGGLVILVSQSDADLKGQTLLTQIGIQGLPDRTGIKGVPNFSITGLSSVTQSLLNPVNDGHAQVSDNLTWIAGKHTMKFGGEYINWFVNRYLTTNSGLFGNYSFTNRYTGNPYADFLLGLPTSVTRLDPFPTQYNRFFDYALFAQDDWKVTQRLTLSFGLRYEYNDPVRSKTDTLYSFDLASGAVVVPNDAARKRFSPFFPTTVPVKTASDLGLDTSLRRPDRNNFAPRAGFSYQLDRAAKTVIRGGAGIYYAHYSGDVAGFLSGGPYSFSTTINNPAGTPAYTLANPFATAGTAGTITLNAISPDLSVSYAIQYSLSVERELGKDIALRVSYIGTGGRQLPYQRNVNQPPPSTTAFAQSRRPYPLYGNINYAENGADSSYNALQTVVSKRFTKGLLFSSSWSWAKSLSEVDDNGDAELNTVIENAYDRRRDRGNVYSVPRHQWMNQALYELPLGQGKLRGGWQLNALVNLQTGNWLNPQFSGSDPSNTNNTAGRPDVSGPISYPQTLGAWFDRTGFTVPAANSGRFGNAGRNTIQGPGFVITNLGLVKSVRFERVTAQLGASFQNLFNHFNYGQPNTTVNNVAGGTITSTHIFPPAGSSRTGQLNLRLTF